MAILNSLCFEIHHHTALSISLTLICLKITLCYLLFWRSFCQKKNSLLSLSSRRIHIWTMEQKQTNKKTKAYLSLEAAVFITGSFIHTFLWVSITHWCAVHTTQCSTYHSVQPYWERRLISSQLCSFLK